MILKVGCAQVLGPSRTPICMSAGARGPRTNVPTLAEARAFRLRDQLRAKRLPSRMAARSLSVVYPELVMFRGCLSEDVVAGVRRLAEA